MSTKPKVSQVLFGFFLVVLVWVFLTILCRLALWLAFLIADTFPLVWVYSMAIGLLATVVLVRWVASRSVDKQVNSSVSSYNELSSDRVEVIAPLRTVLLQRQRDNVMH